MNYLFSLLTGGAGGAVLVFLFKGWISERLRQSIQYEYSEKLESYKTELNSKIESIKHDNQISQLRTSLFFDHQRNAFASLITKISQINEEWMTKYDPEEGLFAPVPYEEYKELKKLYYEHQLFLDEECLMALTLTIDIYSSSFPYDDLSGAPPHQKETRPIVDFIEYLQPRIASLFRKKIGVESDPIHLRELTILTAMKLVNSYNFREIDVPLKGILSTKKITDAADIVLLGENNLDELFTSLTRLNEYLRRDGGWLPEAQLKVKRCLSILNKMSNN